MRNNPVTDAAKPPRSDTYQAASSDSTTRDVKSRRGDSWQDFFDLTETLDIPGDSLPQSHDAPPQKRNLF